MNKVLPVRAVLILMLLHLSAPAWAQLVRSAPAQHATTPAAAASTATLLLEAYNADGSPASGTDFSNYVQFTPTSTWGIYQNYGVFPLGTPPATAQVGSTNPSVVNQNGLQYISFAVPANQPLYFTCLWKAAVIGTVFMRADNAGKGYTLSDNQTQVLQLPYEFALSEYNTASQLISQNSAKGYSFSADANALLLQATASVNAATAATTPSARAVASYAALAVIMPLKERLVLEISSANISRAAPGRSFALNYEGFGGWTNSAFVPNYERATKAGFAFGLMFVDWSTVSPTPGVYDCSVMDYQIDRALTLGYTVSVTVNDLSNNIPKWVYGLSFDELKALYYQNAQAFVTRYQNKVAFIYPAAEIELAQGLYNLAQGAELVSQSLAGARAAAPSMPFGVYLSASAYVGYQLNAQAQCGCFSGWDLAAYLSENNIKPDFLGPEMQYGTIFAPLDLQRVYELLSDLYNVAKIPILIGETGYSTRSQDYADSSSYYWHSGLTEAAQAEWADGLLRIAYGLPFIEGLNWVHVDGDNIDSATAQTCSCLTPEISSLLGTDVFRSDGSPKPSYFVFQSFINTVLQSKPNNLAPVITSVSPAADIGAVGGTGVDFTIEAQDPGGNSLTYTWSVDGVVVSTVFGPSYDWLVPLNATGMHVVGVLVSNGFRSAQATWEINATPGMKPSILFDETHSEQNTINSQTALQLNPQNPNLVCFCELSGYLAQSYQVSRLTQGPITPQVLSGVGVLALAAPNAPLSTAENQAITQFVQQGGGLVFMDNAGVNPAINSLLMPWGLQVNNGVILSPSGPTGCPGCFPLSSFSDSPILGSNPSFEVGDAGSFSVSGQAISLAKTSAAAWSSNSGQAPQQPGEPNGPFTMIASSGSGSGKVLALSNNFYDQFFDAYPENVVLLSSALAWVASGANSVSAPPGPGPPPSITGTASSGSYASAVAPGSWISIFGKNLSNLPAAGRGWAASDFNGNNLPLSLSGTSVLINGRPAAISFVSPGQLNVQGPDDWTTGTVSVVVTAPSGTAMGTANVQPLAPSLFTITLGGVSYAAAVGPDGAYIVPPQQLAGGQTANPGDIIQVFGTGFGSGLPSQRAGMLVSPVPLAIPVSASICGQPATVGYAGLVEPGLNQFNVTVPDVPTGLCSISLSVQGLPTQNGIVVPIGP